MTSKTHSAALRLSDIPEIARPVALHGSLARAEVGGSYCFSIIVSTSLKISR